MVDGMDGVDTGWEGGFYRRRQPQERLQNCLERDGQLGSHKTRKVNASPPFPSSKPPLACDCSCIWTLWLSCFVFFFLSQVETPESGPCALCCFLLPQLCLLLIFGMVSKAESYPWLWPHLQAMCLLHGVFLVAHLPADSPW